MANCTAEAISYADSRWVAAWLPIRYKVRSYLWPNNETDPVDTASSVVDSFGYARLEYTPSFYSDYREGEWVSLSGFGTSSYNGIFRIRDVGTDYIILDLPYVGDDVGDFQKYYQNYRVLVRVTTGVPVGHTLEDKRPWTLRGIVSDTPGDDNVAEIDIASIVRGDLVPHDNDLCDTLDDSDSGDGTIGNDYRAWTAFSVEIAESYDAPNDDGDIVTWTSDWIGDVDADGEDRIFYASNSATQFKSLSGRSMEDYALPSGAMTSSRPEARWLTPFSRPRYYEDREFDLSIISDGTTSASWHVSERDESGTEIATQTDTILDAGPGVYRLAISRLVLNSATRSIRVKIVDDYSGLDYSEEIEVRVDRETCGRDPVYLRWLNPLGGWDALLFPNVDRSIAVSDRTTIRRDVYRDFDDRYRFGLAEDDLVRVRAKRETTVRSSWLYPDEFDPVVGLFYSVRVLRQYADADALCLGGRQRVVLVATDRYTSDEYRRRLRNVELKIVETDEIRNQRQ